MAQFQVELPSGKTVVFKELSFLSRKNAVSRIRQQQNDFPLTLSELLASMAIITIDGHPLLEVDPVMVFDSWSIRDTLLYVDVFTNTGIVSEEDLISSRDKAKQLLKAGKVSLKAVPEAGDLQAPTRK